MSAGQQVAIPTPSTVIPWRWWVVVLATAHFLLFAGLGLARHWGFMTSLNDLGMFDQAVWGLLHGKPFLNTSSPFNVPMNWLGWHFNPVLALFAPLYAIAEAPEWLMIAQAAALAAAAWPLFLLARRISGSERTGFLWAVAYLFNPFLLNGVAWDFHPVTLAVPLVALALFAVETGNGRLLLGSCLPLLLVQEQMGLTVAGFGALWALKQPSRRLGAWLALLGLGQVILVLGVVMPAFSPSQSHPMLSSGLGQVSRYGWLTQALAQPATFAGTVLVDMGGGLYLATLLMTFLFLPLGGLAYCLPGLGDLAANLLSANPMPRSAFAYHSVVLVPILTVAAIHGARKMASRQRRFDQGEFAGMALIPGLMAGYLLAPLPLPGAADFWSPASYRLAADPNVGLIRAVLPENASLSVQANVGAHFSRRGAIHLFPHGIGQVDAVVLHLDNPTRKLGEGSPDELATLAHHLQMRPGAYLDGVEALLSDPGYGVSLWQDNWLVFARGATAGPPPVQERIKARIADLRRDWQPAQDTPNPLEMKTW